MNKITCIMLCLNFCFASVAVAQDEPNQCTLKTTSIYFGNGVNTSRAQAELSKTALKRAYKSSLLQTYPQEIFTFKLAYNDTYGLPADLTETFLQTASQEDRELLGQLSSTQLFSLMTASQQRYNEIAADIRQRFEGVTTGNQLIEFFSIDNQAELRNSAIAATVSATQTSAFAVAVLAARTNETLTQFYRNDLDAGQRVVIVAHSQGNLFARDNVDSVLNTNPEYASSIGAVGVATPSNRQPDNGDYITAHDDRVIDGLRVSTAIDGIAGNEPLASNFENDPGLLNDPRDFLNHGFLTAYFRSSLDSRAHINSLFSSLVQSLSFPESVVGSGAIRVTLEWGAEPDVDLHAYEPDGSHVFYSNLAGTYGTLDRDDVTSFGPENYFVPCDAIAAGIYGFGVNYYDGSNPEIASLVLRLGDGQTTSMNIPLQTAVGTSGNNPPVSLGVEVSVDDQGVFQYSIIESDGVNEQFQTVHVPGVLEQTPK